MVLMNKNGNAVSPVDWKNKTIRIDEPITDLVAFYKYVRDVTDAEATLDDGPVIRLNCKPASITMLDGWEIDFTH